MKLQRGYSSGSKTQRCNTRDVGVVKYDMRISLLEFKNKMYVNPEPYTIGDRLREKTMQPVKVGPSLPSLRAADIDFVSLYW